MGHQMGHVLMPSCGWATWSRNSHRPCMGGIWASVLCDQHVMTHEVMQLCGSFTTYTQSPHLQHVAQLLHARRQRDGSGSSSRLSGRQRRRIRQAGDGGSGRACAGGEAKWGRRAEGGDNLSGRACAAGGDGARWGRRAGGGDNLSSACYAPPLPPTWKPCDERQQTLQCDPGVGGFKRMQRGDKATRRNRQQLLLAGRCSSDGGQAGGDELAHGKPECGEEECGKGSMRVPRPPL